MLVNQTLKRFFSKSATCCAVASRGGSIAIGAQRWPSDDQTNVGRNLHQQPHHPLGIMKSTIAQLMGPGFILFDNLSPVVTVQQNFDQLLVPQDHVSRSRHDSYYINKELLLRTHTSAHQAHLLNAGHDAFLVAGDVYRRDEIDQTHYPVFHQMEGVRVFPFDSVGGRSTSTSRLVRSETKQEVHTQVQADFVVKDLKDTLNHLAKGLFPDVEIRWVNAYFPFTHPSFEMEVNYEGAWMEVLGCGVIEQKICDMNGMHSKFGWAFGLGLERLAMAQFKIPDIRLFWSKDDRFLSQFSAHDLKPRKFLPFSKYPATTRDISFWINANLDASATARMSTDRGDCECEFHDNSFMDCVRTVAGDLVERVELVDQFVHPQSLRSSKCFRITYRSMDRTLCGDEVSKLHESIRTKLSETLPIELR